VSPAWAAPGAASASIGCRMLPSRMFKRVTEQPLRVTAVSGPGGSRDAEAAVRRGRGGPGRSGDGRRGSGMRARALRLGVVLRGRAAWRAPGCRPRTGAGAGEGWPGHPWCAAKSAAARAYCGEGRARPDRIRTAAGSWCFGSSVGGVPAKAEASCWARAEGGRPSFLASLLVTPWAVCSTWGGWGACAAAAGRAALRRTPGEDGGRAGSADALHQGHHLPGNIVMVTATSYENQNAAWNG
jgi:hypothetical protein